MSNPWLLFSGMTIGMVGMGLLMYGKKAEDLRAVFGGLALSIVPFVGHSMLALWGMTAACCAGLWLWNKAG